ncbi:hypothetical protein KZZ52_33665 [Dactylosporangium sp. AC04546]|uniref:hypothetical protein n=1 Tax=Dactylosporangium sp. AC04546 TaxID=2862460 RepID=UPI002E7BFF05|nr:hypothetical protein [Dactylosporangium sp. AC04546]WVK78924.1 hypothetical protein KZZ52_33665 [Dactylosporangium sp. AC04546]
MSPSISTSATRPAAPEAIGDIVAGQPPVPISVWYLPAAPAGDTMSLAVAERLVMNYTHGRRLVVDLTSGNQLAQAVIAARRGYRRCRPAELADAARPASLVVAGWPAEDLTAQLLLAGSAARLMAGGCVVVVLDGADLLINQVLIAAAYAAGLTYLQHIVVAHAGTRVRDTADSVGGMAGTSGSEQPDGLGGLAFRDGFSGVSGQLRDGGSHLRVHTDVLVFSRPADQHQHPAPFGTPPGSLGGMPPAIPSGSSLGTATEQSAGAAVEGSAEASPGGDGG